jgi:hypothetical protein
VKPGDDIIKGEHDKYADHFFMGVCICSCPRCTMHGTEKGKDKLYCIDPACPSDKCGLKFFEQVVA